MSEFNEDDNGESGKKPSINGDEKPYEVGDKKPPKEHQYKPGESGNPKGRPKGSVSFDTKLEKELAKFVTVNKSGKPVKMSKEDVGITRLVERYMSGDLKAWAIVLGVKSKNAKSKADEGSPDDIALPDEANLQFIYQRLKGLVGGGSDGSGEE